MKKLTKILCMLLTLVFVAGLVGCGSVAANTVFSADDLEGKKIGVQLGTTGDLLMSDLAAELGNGTTVEQYSKTADAIQALKLGKLDCVVLDIQPATSYIANNDDLMMLDDILSDTEEYAICVAQSNTELLEKINQALAELEAEGTLDAIINNYIGDDAGSNPYVSPEDVDRSNGTLIMATNATFEPYEYYDGTVVVGIDADIAQAICDKLGMTLQIEDMEFDAIITAVQSGKADFGIAALTVTEERLENVSFSTTYAVSRQVIVVRKN